MRGRKTRLGSRGIEFRQRLIEWKQTPERLRPSLRALARQLGTSHQLLKHYLDGLEKWRYMERHRKATAESDQIIVRAIVEDRAMTQWEEERYRACKLTAMRATLASLVLDHLTTLKQEARRGPLNPAQFKILKIFAKQRFPGAEELSQKCSQVGVKERKRFSEIVKETPRQEGEMYIDWVRRIWDHGSKYETKYPTVITEELLQRYSEDTPKTRRDNLPVISISISKSFETVSG